jgi:hypothetical protein
MNRLDFFKALGGGAMAVVAVALLPIPPKTPIRLYLFPELATPDAYWLTPKYRRGAKERDERFAQFVREMGRNTAKTIEDNALKHFKETSL